MKRTAFTVEDVEKWQFDISRFRPTPISDPVSEPAFTPRTVSLYGTRQGVVARFADASGEELTLRINAPMALYLAAAIERGGKDMKWLEDNGDISLPVLDD
jgi:hypothetical protein